MRSLFSFFQSKVFSLNRNFTKFWLGQTVSLFGTQISRLALPLLAIQLLEFNSNDVGLLRGALSAGSVCIIVFAGTWVDRIQRKPILMLSNLLQAILILFVVAAIYFQFLSKPNLIVVMFLIGSLSAIFYAAYFAYIPYLLTPDTLVEGNSKLEGSRAVAEVAGPGLAGLLIQLVTIPAALLGDSISFIVSALFILTIDEPEEPKSLTSEQSFFRQISQGVHLVFSSVIVQRLMASSTMFVFFETMLQAQLLLYLVDYLNLPAHMIGFVFMGEGLGALIGAYYSNRLSEKLGIGKLLFLNAFVGGAVTLLIPLLGGSLWFISVFLFFIELVKGIGRPIYNICSSSIVQVLISNKARGRVGATMRLFTGVSAMLGAVISGVVGSYWSVSIVIWLAAIGLSLTFLWIYFSPLMRINTLDDVSVFTP